ILAGKYAIINGSNAYIINTTSESASMILYITGSVKVTTETEAILALTEDDYGTSYYYRGAVENNYVAFAGMCWRIVRVDGLGNTKLVLYNYNPNEVDNPCATSEDGTSNAFARYSESTYTSVFNSSRDKNAYVGFMYGTPGSSTYEAEHANTNKSTILTNLETWYDDYLGEDAETDYTDLLADVIWCNDKSLNTDSDFNPLGSSYTPTNLGYNTEVTYYGATTRLLDDKATSWTKATTSKVTLVCPEAGSDGKLSKFTVSDTTNGNGALDKKIGLLTADEIAFAGAAYGTSNTLYYLRKNASGNYWWSLSPDVFFGAHASGWSVYVNGYLSGSNYVNNALGVRPSVSLVSTASVTTASETNPGTASNPYIIGVSSS
ncbi:DUF6273 domain-containing protein, partial [uncultured Methanobrevibacter sp.]|uniref:DUF6273 domain-containing protein n=1 Tax=uncultured Methanobrevibacter sp. TaxID=253161 RepID=UPI002605BB1D